jgi:hypothetical protein
MYKLKEIVTDYSSLSLTNPETQIQLPFFWFARTPSLSNNKIPSSVVSSCTVNPYGTNDGAMDCSPKNGLHDYHDM